MGTTADTQFLTRMSAGAGSDQQRDGVAAKGLQHDREKAADDTRPWLAECSDPLYTLGAACWLSLSVTTPMLVGLSGDRVRSSL